MSRAKKKGTAFETACVRHLQANLPWLDISRQTLHGSKDVGDIRGLETYDLSFAVECKDTRVLNVPEHVREAIAEMDNAGASAWLLIQHWPGASTKTPEGMGQQLVAMDMNTFITLMMEAHQGERK